MPQRGWLTPNEGATEFVCRPVYIPIDDELFFMAAVNGALNALTREWNWEQYGTLTPAEAAELMLTMYTSYTEEECCSGLTCTIPPAFEIDLEFPLKIIRVGPDGFIEELVGNEWVTPTGVYETPDPEPRTEPTLDERRCLAAANAAFVYEAFYEEATDAYSEFGTAVEVASAILGTIQTLLGVFGQYQAASHMSFATNAFDTFSDLFGLITGDVWNAAFTEELICILYDQASEVGGVIVFDYMSILADIHDLRLAAGADPDRQILLIQLEYLLNLVGAGGLNVAGGTTAVEEYDCELCEEWEQVILDGEGSHGFAAINARPFVQAGLVNCTCTYDGTNDEFTRCYNGRATSTLIYCFSSIISKSIADTHITNVRIFPDHDITTPTANNHVELILKQGGSVVVDVGTTDYDTTLEWEGDEIIDEIQVVVATQNLTGDNNTIASILRMEFAGLGTNPF